LVAFLLVLFLFALAGSVGSQALAQDVPPPADGGAAPPASSEPPPKTNFFIHIIKSLGITFIIIFGVMSVTLLALIVLLAMDLRLGAAIPPAFVEDFTDTVNKRRFKEAYELARQDSSYLARVLTTGMSRLQYGIEDARAAANNMVDTVRAGKEQFISYLATIGTVGPLLGLVGTVIGMIGAFMELGRAGATPRFDVLAGNLSHALVVTLFGIGMAVPAIFCQVFFHNRLVRLAMDTSNLADDLLTQMYHNSKRPGAGPSTGSSPVGAESRPASTAAIKTAE
jgi:biopolymer transport protein ExbB